MCRPASLSEESSVNAPPSSPLPAPRRPPLLHLVPFSLSPAPTIPALLIHQSPLLSSHTLTQTGPLIRMAPAPSATQSCSHPPVANRHPAFQASIPTAPAASTTCPKPTRRSSSGPTGASSTSLALARPRPSNAPPSTPEWPSPSICWGWTKTAYSPRPLPALRPSRPSKTPARPQP